MPEKKCGALNVLKLASAKKGADYSCTNGNTDMGSKKFQLEKFSVQNGSVRNSDSRIFSEYFFPILVPKYFNGIDLENLLNKGF